MLQVMRRFYASAYFFFLKSLDKFIEISYNILTRYIKPIISLLEEVTNT